MSKHTPGQLVAVQHYSDSLSITDSRGFEIVEVPGMAILLGYQEKLGVLHWADRPGESFRELDQEEQAAIVRRIVACWNACDGLTTEAVEFTIVRQREMLALKAQRDELLALVKRYRTETPIGHQPHMIAHEADAAIAKANGGAA